MFLPLFSQGQSGIWKSLHLADSLILIEHLGEADSILLQVEAVKPIDTRLKMELTYQRAFYLSSKEMNQEAVTALLGLPEKAIKWKFYDLAAKTYILLELIHEKTPDFPDAWKNLNRGLQLIREHKLDSLYGWCYVRTSSFYRLNNKPDSAIHYAKKAIPFTYQYNQPRVFADACLLLGIVYNKLQPGEGLIYFQSALKSFLSQKNDLAASAMYGNLSQIYLKKGNVEKALAYNDSALRINASLDAYDLFNWKYRSEIFYSTKQYDSALYYYKLYSNGVIENLEKNEVVEIKKLGEKYEVANKEIIIRAQQNKLHLVLGLTACIVFALAYIYRQNIRITGKNKKIELHVTELNKLVQQKQILFAELQHRVKNNLQQILSLMDIQKESLNHNNIEEVIRENQNRVYGIALLHDKLSSTGSGNVVNFDQYLNEMAALMKSAYYNPGKDVSIEVVCDEKEFTMDVAIPLGLVVVELLSNGLKHAFKQKKMGTIKLAVTKDKISLKKRLDYEDDGLGFDFHQRQKKGLGLELIDGLLKEFNGTLYTKQVNGTGIFILF